jgi:hypothetical protein
VASAGLIFGDVSVVFVGLTGEQQAWSMYPQLQPDGKSLRRWGKIHDGESLAGKGEGVYPAEGNKCYLAVAGGKLQLRNMTTGSLRWEGDAPAGSIRQLAFAGNYDRFTASPPTVSSTAGASSTVTRNPPGRILRQDLV